MMESPSRKMDESLRLGRPRRPYCRTSRAEGSPPPLGLELRAQKYIDAHNSKMGHQEDTMEGMEADRIWGLHLHQEFRVRLNRR